jgi:glycosyltransferase involved in cell wall biosynthesis
MKIGIDLSSLQGPHRLRGIGSVLLNFLNNIPDEAKEEHMFIFFVLPSSYTTVDAFENLGLGNMNYEVRELTPIKPYPKTLPGRLNLIVSALNQLKSLRDYRFGDSRVKPGDLKDLDAYFQIDPDKPLPKKRHKLKSVLFIHDLIPYVLEWDYLWSYKTARLKGYSRKAALRVQSRRTLYLLKYRSVIRNASILIANSHHTKEDFVRFLSIRPKKITVAQLGVGPVDTKSIATKPVTAYRPTSWGYLSHEQPFNEEDVPFLLYVGGADRRRKLEDLVTAFNHLRAQGISLKLVLCGDSMQGPMSIATEEIQYALKTSSYLEDIIFLGYCSPETIDWLYGHALAFVFPSRYEGFGLPVLEAMAHGCIVVSYPNKATKEVAEDTCLFVNGPLEIRDTIIDLINRPSAIQKDTIAAAKHRAKSFSWEKTATEIMNTIASL